MVSLKDREWKEFYVYQVFSHVTNSKAYHKDNLNVDYSNEGIAYITRTNKNNGLEGIVDKSQLENLPNNKNTLSLGAENATFFFHPYDYITGNKMYILKSQNINKQVGLFLQLVLNKSIQGCGFGFATGLTGNRAKNRQFLLPIDNKGNPDWIFMENYIKQLEFKLKEEYKDFATKKLQKLEYKKIPALEEKTWKTFEISKLFKIEKCKCSNISNFKNGNVPYIGATNKNNGILKFVKNRQDLLTKGRCIVFICDGEGSIGYSTYQDADFIGSTTLKVGRNLNMNKYHIMFISIISDKVRTKYNFGYKRTTAHLKNEMILLPLRSDNTPDYDYMEQYIKNVMYKQLMSYLEICK